MANISTLGNQNTVVGNDYVAKVEDTQGGGTATTPMTPPAGQTNPVQVDYTPPAPTQTKDATQSGSVVQGYLNDLLSQDSAYMRNAQQQGLNQAAARGLRNSSIAVGAAQASNIQNAQPILSNIMSLNNQREQQSFQGEQAQFDRNLTTARDNANIANQTNLQNAQLAYQTQQAALNRVQSVNDKILQAELAGKQAAQDYQFKSWLQDAGAKQQDWLNSNQYSRELNGVISQLQLNTSADMFKQIVNAAINNPQTFPPEVAAGMQNYFTGNWAAVLGKYFPNTVKGA